MSWFFTQRPRDPNERREKPVPDLACDHCGQLCVQVKDQPDAIRIECLLCGTVDFIWKEDQVVNE